MIDFKAAAVRPAMGQFPAIAPASIPDPVPPPDPTFTGLAGWTETLAVLAVLGAGAWAGIRTGMSPGADSSLKVAGWVGGVGSALLGALYLGTKIDLVQEIGVPAVRVTPT